MEVKPGYKQTEVGVIPEEWDVKRIGDLGNVVRGGSPRPAGDPRYFEGNFIPWLTVAALTNIPDHQLEVSETATCLTEEGSKHSRTLAAETLIIANSGATLGVAKLLKMTCCANDGIAAIINQRLGEKRFISFYINTQTKKLREVVATGNGQPNLNTGLIRGISIPFPPPPEQRAIAEALSDVDGLLGGLDRLIAKKRDLKQAAMQQLLTGQTRLPGFEKEQGYKQTEVGILPRDWDVPKLESIITDISMGPFGSDITVSNFVSTGVPVLSGANVASERLVDGFENFVTQAKARSLKKAVARRGDIVVTHRGTIGQIAYIPEDSEYDRYVVSQSQFRVRFSDDAVIPAWVVLYFHSEGGSKRLLEGKGHTGVPAIAQPTRTFRNLGIPRPTIAEQTAIIEVLTDMEVELATLEQRREKTRALKQAMMQELLTGKTRLV